MDALDILNRLHDLGVQVTVNGSKLRLQPVSVIPPDFVQVVKERKADILDVLRVRKLESRYVPPSGSASREETLEIELRIKETGVSLLGARHSTTSWHSSLLRTTPETSRPASRSTPSASYSCYSTTASRTGRPTPSVESTPTKKRG